MGDQTAVRGALLLGAGAHRHWGAATEKSCGETWESLWGKVPLQSTGYVFIITVNNL